MSFDSRKIFFACGGLLCVFIYFLLGLIYSPQVRMDPVTREWDFYGHIELARNIFLKGDYTVNWELDSPLQYPPFYSIFIYYINLLVKDFTASMQYLGIGSVSFGLIPLVALVKKLLGLKAAFLAVICTAFYFGFEPCRNLFADYFFWFLIMTTCWLVWHALQSKERTLVYFVLAGVLVSCAYLTKFSGLYLLFASAASVFYYHFRNKQSLARAFKMIACLVLGALPLMIFYHFSFQASRSGRVVPTIAAHTFFDGNYHYLGGRKAKMTGMYGLNSEKKEFSYPIYLKNISIGKFVYENPRFIVEKYSWGLNNMVQRMSSCIFPLPQKMRQSLFYQAHFSFLPYVIFFLPVVVWLLLRRDEKMLHVLLFGLPIVGIPLFFGFGSHMERYALPFISFFFISWLFVFYTFYTWALSRVSGRGRFFLRVVALVCSGAFILLHVWGGYKKFLWLPAHPNFLKVWVSTCVKQDWGLRQERPRIMAPDPGWAYLAGAEHIMSPQDATWQEMLRFAVHKNADYVLITKSRFLKHRSFRQEFPNVHVICELKDNRRSSLVLRIDRVHEK